MKVKGRLSPAVWILTISVLFLTSCEMRSISNSGYPSGRQSENPFYKGELTEFQVLGIDTSQGGAEEQIKLSLANGSDVALTEGSSVMVIQSGAVIPDENMVKRLEEHFSVGVFSGVPQDGAEAGDFSRSLRLAAAKGGYRTIICYWGILESGKENKWTKTISWTPFVGWNLPDETEHMRIRLKVALINVESGGWRTFMPEASAQSANSSIMSREGVDQDLVSAMKDKSYKAAVEELVARYVK